jgi:hypothetical protein
MIFEVKQIVIISIGFSAQKKKKKKKILICVLKMIIGKYMFELRLI